MSLVCAASADSQPAVAGVTPAGPERQALENRLEAEIAGIEALGDPNSALLIDPLTALGVFHQTEGNYFLARAAVQRARELVRMNRGLYSLDQASLMRRQVEIEVAIGNNDVAWDLEQEMLTLARRHPADSRSARILRDTAERRMQILDSYLAGDWPPEIYLGCYYHGMSLRRQQLFSCSSGSSGVLKRSLALEAQQLYSRAIAVNLRGPEPGGSDVTDLLADLMQSSHPYGSAGFARRVLRDVLTYQTLASEPLEQRVDTLTQLGDWTLLHSNSGRVNESALTIYRQAHALNAWSRSDPDPSADALFSPEIPVVLPAFAGNPLVTRETATTRGHIDLEMEVSKYGRARRISILDSSENVSRADRRRLIRLLRRARFRPLMQDGEFPETARVAFRYHLDRAVP